MDEDEVAVLVRAQAFGVAYRMLGCVADAEDVAQEVALRHSQLEQELRETGAWVRTVTTRASIDVLRRARVRRTAYVGPWLPDPLVNRADDATGPEDRAVLRESVSQAFLVVLERLTPTQRAAFLLREVFAEDYASIASTLGCSQASCRQLVSRARAHVREDRTRFDTDPERGRLLVKRFLAAAEDGHLAELTAMLAEDVVLIGDGGGTAPSPLHPLTGARAVADFLVMIAGKRRELGPFDLELVTVNGHPGRILRTGGGRVWDVLTIDVLAGRVQAVRIIRNPVKTAHLDVVTR